MTRPWPALLTCLALTTGCAEVTLPDLTVPAGDDGTRFGVDTRDRDYTFGLHVTDPLHQRSP